MRLGATPAAGDGDGDMRNGSQCLLCERRQRRSNNRLMLRSPVPRKAAM
jgi:hypothetical protein